MAGAGRGRGLDGADAQPVGRVLQGLQGLLVGFVVGGLLCVPFLDLKFASLSTTVDLIHLPHRYSGLSTLL